MGEGTTLLARDLLELAASVMRQLPQVKPVGLFNVSPKCFQSFADTVSQEPQVQRRRPSPRQITQAEEAIYWPR